MQTHPQLSSKTWWLEDWWDETFKEQVIAGRGRISSRWFGTRRLLGYIAASAIAFVLWAPTLWKQATIRTTSSNMWAQVTAQTEGRNKVCSSSLKPMQKSSKVTPILTSGVRLTSPSSGHRPCIGINANPATRKPTIGGSLIDLNATPASNATITTITSTTSPSSYMNINNISPPLAAPWATKVCTRYLRVP